MLTEASASTLYHQHVIRGIDIGSNPVTVHPSRTDGVDTIYRQLPLIFFAGQPARPPTPPPAIALEAGEEELNEQNIRDNIDRLIVGVTEDIERREARTERDRRRLRSLEDARDI